LGTVRADYLGISRSLVPDKRRKYTHGITGECFSLQDQGYWSEEKKIWVFEDEEREYKFHEEKRERFNLGNEVLDLK